MTFTPKDWRNFPDTTTPISAAALEDMETRVTDYVDVRVGSVVLSVLEFGATGDGVADDTAEIDAALAAADDGMTVFFPGSGPYLTSGEHEVPEGVTVAGDGRAISNIWHDGGGYCFRLMDERSGGRGCGLRGLSIQGSAAGFSATADATGVEVTNGLGHRLDDIFIYGYTDAGRGLCFRNRNGSLEFVEQTKGFGVAVVNCENLIEFIQDAGGGDSFGYTTLYGLQMQIYEDQTAISVGDGCTVYNGHFQGSLHYTGDTGTGVYVSSTGLIWAGTHFQIVGEVLSGTGLRRIFNEGQFQADGKFQINGMDKLGQDDVLSATNHNFAEVPLTFAELDPADRSIPSSGFDMYPPSGCDSWFVTGTTNIQVILGNYSYDGRMVTFRFEGVLTVVDGGNLALAGNFVTTANDTLTLRYENGTWYEVARSVN